MRSCGRVFSTSVGPKVCSEKLEHGGRGRVPFKGPLRDIEPSIGHIKAALEDAYRMIYAGLPSFFVLGLEDFHVPTFWLLI